MLDKYSCIHFLLDKYLHIHNSQNLLKKNQIFSMTKKPENFEIFKTETKKHKSKN